MENLEEFLAKIKPGAKKSKLLKFLPVLKTLRDKEYTLAQLQIFLLEVEKVNVSIPWLSAFLRSHDDKLVLEKGEATKSKPSTAEQTEVELVRPPGITDATWNEMRAAARAAKRKQKHNSGE